MARRILRGSDDSRIVLLTDGHDSGGRALAEALAAAADGIPIDVAVPPDLESRPITLDNIRAPVRVQLSEAFSLELLVSGPAGAIVSLELERDGALVERREVRMRSDGVNAFTLADRLDSGGFHLYEARARVESPQADSAGGGVGDEVGAVVYASGRPRLTYIGESGRMAALIPPLEADGFLVDVIDPASILADSIPFDRTDVVILDDVAAERLDTNLMTDLANWVRLDGGGLIMTGGVHSFAPGGYVNTPIEDVLPLDLRVRDRQRVPRLGFVLVLDKSGSMAAEEGGLTKIGVAEDAALAVPEYLDGDDLIGIIAFDREPRTVVGLTRVSEANDIEARVRVLDAGGDTAIAPAIDDAYSWLENSAEADRKHVLLLSDGQSDEDDVRRLRERIDGSDVVLSVVGIGSEIDRAFLRDLAVRGGGQAYFPESLRSLPEVFTREAIRASGDWLVEGEVSLDPSPGHRVLSGLDTDSLPSIHGYIAATAKASTDAVLNSDLGDPVAILGRYGLGRSAAITTDLSSVWAADLVRWPGFGTLWTRIARSVTPGTGDDILNASLRIEDRALVVSVEAVRPDGTFVDGLLASLAARLPSNDVRRQVLSQVAPGRYEATLPLELGAYELSIDALDRSNGAAYSTLVGEYVTRLPERHVGGINRRLLQQLTEMTGGRFLGTGEGPFAGPRRVGRGRELWRWFALTGVLLFLVDVGVRRGVRLADLRRAFERDAVPDGLSEGP